MKRSNSRLMIPFQPTLPVWGATNRFAQCCKIFQISTHAPRAGSDIPQHCGDTSHFNFNPRSPCGERQISRTRCPSAYTFQPTLPVRGATSFAIRHSLIARFQPTLPVRGATRLESRADLLRRFQPTLPVRGATRPVQLLALPVLISTHAPRAGSDAASAGKDGRAIDFNPRSPCGERPDGGGAARAVSRFQPTLPVRGATCSRMISWFSTIFQPTLPVRGATHDGFHLL